MFACFTQWSIFLGIGPNFKAIVVIITGCVNAWCEWMMHMLFDFTKDSRNVTGKESRRGQLTFIKYSWPGSYWVRCDNLVLKTSSINDECADLWDNLAVRILKIVTNGHKNVQGGNPFKVWPRIKIRLWKGQTVNYLQIGVASPIK